VHSKQDPADPLHLADVDRIEHPFVLIAQWMLRFWQNLRQPSLQSAQLSRGPWSVMIRLDQAPDALVVAYTQKIPAGRINVRRPHEFGLIRQVKVIVCHSSAGWYDCVGGDGERGIRCIDGQELASVGIEKREEPLVAWKLISGGVLPM
jgi:hypothetical protein